MNDLALSCPPKCVVHYGQVIVSFWPTLHSQDRQLSELRWWQPSEAMQRLAVQHVGLQN